MSTFRILFLLIRFPTFGLTVLCIDHTGLLWIGTGNGINIYDRVNKKIKLFDPPGKNYAAINKEVGCILEDHSGNIWVGLSGQLIYRYDPSTGTSKIYRHSAADKNSLPSDQVTSLMEDSHHTIWVAMSEALVFTSLVQTISNLTAKM